MLFTLGLAAAVLLLAGCSERTAPASTTDQNGAELPDGWAPAGEEQLFDSEAIFELVNGQADAYSAYNFEQVAVRSYEHEDGSAVDAEIWRVTTPGDAYGLFTGNRAGEPVQIGKGGDADPGRRLAFWQDRNYVRIRSRQHTPDDALLGLATAIAAELPDGGELPGLVRRLPPGGLVPESEIYFYLESPIQDWVWLGGENILGLDLDTAGVLARYQLNGTVARLVLIEFDDAKAADDALQALRAVAIKDLVAVGVEGSLLAAVFGDLPDANGGSLVSEALGGG